MSSFTAIVASIEDGGFRTSYDHAGLDVRVTATSQARPSEVVWHVPMEDAPRVGDVVRVTIEATT